MNYVTLFNKKLKILNKPFFILSLHKIKNHYYEISIKN